MAENDHSSHNSSHSRATSWSAFQCPISRFLEMEFGWLRDVLSWSTQRLLKGLGQSESTWLQKPVLSEKGQLSKKGMWAEKTSQKVFATVTTTDYSSVFLTLKKIISKLSSYSTQGDNLQGISKGRKGWWSSSSDSVSLSSAFPLAVCDFDYHCYFTMIP